MLKVFSECCKNCLLSADAIVGPDRRKEIIGDCTRNQSHFICNIASINDEEILCKTFYDNFGHVSQMVRISERLGMVEFVEQPENERKPSYNDMKK